MPHWPWLVIGAPTTTSSNPCVLGFSTIDLAMSIMLEVLPIGTERHWKYAIQFPSTFPTDTIELRALGYDTLGSQKVMSRRLRITTP